MPSGLGSWEVSVTQAGLCIRGWGQELGFLEALELKWCSFLIEGIFEHVNMSRSHQGGQKGVLWMEEWQQGFAPDGTLVTWRPVERPRDTEQEAGGCVTEKVPDLNRLLFNAPVRNWIDPKGRLKGAFRGQKGHGTILHCRRQASSS